MKANYRFLVASLLGMTVAWQDPPRALTIVAPAAPGGGWDQTARVMQQVLRETGLARSVQVVNTPGAAGTIGLARFVRSERGNASALLVTGLVMVSGIEMNHAPVTLAQVTPIARLSGEYEVIVVPASSPFRSLADLTAAFRADPRAVSWGGGSAGGTDEILVRLLAERLGLDPAGVNYVAYSGGGQALAAVLGSHVSAAVSGLGEFASQIEAGALRALAISSPGRVPGVDIPTFREQGVELDLLNWRGVVAPPGLSPVQTAALAASIDRMAATPEWKAALERNGWADIYMKGEPFGRFIATETARVRAVIGAGRAAAGSGAFASVVLAGLALSLIAAFVTQAVRVQPGVRWNRALLTLALGLVGAIALFEPGGFVVASAALFVVTARAFGSRRVVRDALIGVALSFVIHLGFTRALGVSLPAGILGG